MRKNKMSIMFMVSILALAGIGISYAGWTDTITVSGVVSNGDVDMNVIEYSGTWVWKTVSDHGLIRHHEFSNVEAYDTDPIGYYGDDGYMLVSKAWAAPTMNGDQVVDDSVTITFDNLFPCQDFVADFLVKYEGSIPARLARSLYINTNPTDGPYWNPNVAMVPGATDWMDDLWLYHADNPGFGIWIETYDVTDIDVDNPTPEEYLEGTLIEYGHQVHEGDMLYFRAIIHIPQNNIYQGCSGSFDFDLFAMQWDTFDAEIGNYIYPQTQDA